MLYVGFIIFIVVGSAIFIPLSKYADKKMMERFEKQRGDITEDKILEHWTAKIEGAKGRRDELLERVERRLEKENLPNVRVSKNWFDEDGKEGLHKLVIVSNDALKGYEMLVGADDYGNHLKVSWYLIFDSPEYMGVREARASVWGNVERAKRQNDTWRRLAGRHIPPERLSMSGRDDLKDYTEEVQRIVRDEMEQMMHGLNIDYSKVDGHTRGFENLS